MSNIIKFILCPLVVLLVTCKDPQHKATIQSQGIIEDSLSSNTAQEKISIGLPVSNEDSLHYNTYKQLGFEHCKIYYKTIGYHVVLDENKTINTNNITGDTIFLIAENNRYYALLHFTPYSIMLEIYGSHNSIIEKRDFSTLSLSNNNISINAAEVYIKGDVESILSRYNLKYNLNYNIQVVKKEVDWIDVLMDNPKESTLIIKSKLRQNPSITTSDTIVKCKYFKHGVNSEITTASHRYLLSYFILPEDYCDDALYLISLRLCRVK